TPPPQSPDPRTSLPCVRRWLPATDVSGDLTDVDPPALIESADASMSTIIGRQHTASDVMDLGNSSDIKPPSSSSASVSSSTTTTTTTSSSTTLPSSGGWRTTNAKKRRERLPPPPAGLLVEIKQSADNDNKKAGVSTFNCGDDDDATMVVDAAPSLASAPLPSARLWMTANSRRLVNKLENPFSSNLVLPRSFEDVRASLASTSEAISLDQQGALAAAGALKVYHDQYPDDQSVPMLMEIADAAGGRLQPPSPPSPSPPTSPSPPSPHPPLHVSVHSAGDGAIGKELVARFSERRLPAPVVVQSDLISLDAGVVKRVNGELFPDGIETASKAHLCIARYCFYGPAYAFATVRAMARDLQEGGVFAASVRRHQFGWLMLAILEAEHAGVLRDVEIRYGKLDPSKDEKDVLVVTALRGGALIAKMEDMEMYNIGTLVGA
ncbi:hypothetical protein TeGR_g908, partial [Tetraparma gracilis]